MYFWSWCWFSCSQENVFNNLYDFIYSVKWYIHCVWLWSAEGAAASAPVSLSPSHPDILAGVAVHPFCVPSGSHVVSWRCISAPVTAAHGQFRHHRQDCCKLSFRCVCVCAALCLTCFWNVAVLLVKEVNSVLSLQDMISTFVHVGWREKHELQQTDRAFNEILISAHSNLCHGVTVNSCRLLNAPFLQCYL